MAAGGIIILVAAMLMAVMPDACEPQKVSENVIFRKTREVSITQARWLFTFVIDLGAYESFAKQIRVELFKSEEVLENLKLVPVGQGQYEKLLNSYREEVQSMKTIYYMTMTGIKEILSLREKATRRTKRTLVPLVGKGLSFLFGTATKSDVRVMRKGLEVLSTNQESLIHVIQDSLSIINITRIELTENRHAINNLSLIVGELDKKFTNITQGLKMDLLILNGVVQTYSRISLMILEIKESLDKALLYLETIKLQLNQLALGHLSPSVISPKQLQDILYDIQKHIPEYLSLPQDPKTIWYYYQSLTTVTIIKRKKLLTLVSLPLIDTNSRYELYQIFNLPVPYNLTRMTAQYELETNHLAVNIKRTQYMLLSDTDFLQCAAPRTSFCALRKPSFPLHDSQICVTALFLKDVERIENFCKTIVTLNNKLPIALYISYGTWVVITVEPIVFTVMCVGNKRYQTTVRPAVSYVALNMSCHAFSDQMTLPPYYYHESEYHLKFRQADLLHLKKFTGDIVWGPLDELGDDIDLIDEINRLPKLNDIDNIPLSQLIKKLHQTKIVAMTPVQKRHRYVTFTLGGLMILLMTGVGAVGIVYWRYPGILINCFKKIEKTQPSIYNTCKCPNIKW